MANSVKKIDFQYAKIASIVIGSFIIAFGVLTFFQNNFNKTPSFQTNVLKIGSIVEPFKLQPFESNTLIPFEKIHAKVVIINFWASWCDACIEEMPSLVELWEKYHSQGLEILAVNLDENPSKVVPHMIQSLKMPFPVFKDEDGKLADIFNIHAIPLTVIVNSERKVLYIKDGGFDWNSQMIQDQVKQWLTL